MGSPRLSQGAAELVADLAGGVDAEGVVDRRTQVGREVAARGGIGGDLVGLADHLAAAHAAAGEDGREDAGPVVAAGASARRRWCCSDRSWAFGRTRRPSPPASHPAGRARRDRREMPRRPDQAAEATASGAACSCRCACPSCSCGPCWPGRSARRPGSAAAPARAIWPNMCRP